jgi:hypothetical protein
VSTDPPQPTASPPADSAAATPDASSGKKKSGKAERRRGMETMFRVTYRNHIALSQLADQKAGMLININGLIISVIIAVLTPRLDTWSWALLPSVVLIAGCLGSLAFAVISVRPRIDRTPVTVDDVRNNQGNVLFFGHFLNMPLGDFQAAVRELGKDRKLLQDSMSRQLYAMGEALQKKYRYLQFAYTSFLVGIGVAAALFAVLLAGLALTP